MIVNKPISEMSKFEFSDMMITLRAQYNALRANVYCKATNAAKYEFTSLETKLCFGEDLSKFYMQITDIFYRQRNRNVSNRKSDTTGIVEIIKEVMHE